MTTNEFLTLRDVAAILRISVRTARKYVQWGEIKGRLVGGRWRFRREAVDRFFDSCPKGWDISQKAK